MPDQAVWILIKYDISRQPAKSVNNIFRVRFQILTAVSMKVTVLWNIVSCLIHDDHCFRGAYCHHQG
jgi:hypothetical protein